MTNMHIRYILFFISTLANEVVIYGTLSIQQIHGTYNMYRFKGRLYLHLVEVVRRMRLKPKIMPYPVFNKVLLI
jgi:hypothetical protein